jgi:hypothetical protein
VALLPEWKGPDIRLIVCLLSLPSPDSSSLQAAKL